MNNKDWTGNGNSVWKALGASNHTDEERERNDYYATSPTAIDRLLKYEKPSKAIWECAVGGGHLAARLKELGYEVFASDIIDRGYEGTQIIDFLSADKMFCDGDIMTNPPYKYATEFVEKSLELLRDGHKCYMFLKLTFLEGKKRYVKIFKHTPPVMCMYFRSGWSVRRMRSLSVCEKVVVRQWRMRGLCGRKDIKAKR